VWNLSEVSFSRATSERGLFSIFKGGGDFAAGPVGEQAKATATRNKSERIIRI
jgi:hypothetical protein